MLCFRSQRVVVVLRPCVSLFALALCFAAGALRAQTPVPDPGLQLDYDSQVKPLLVKYCYDCHAGADAKAAVALDLLPATVDKRATREAWRKVHAAVKSSLMPPGDSEQPAPDERATLTAWMTSHPLAVVCNGAPAPGHVTARRLTRYQYANTIRDLMGFAFEAASDFPSDDVGYGFDNIGDVLSLSPVLFERYMAAAESIARRAIVTLDRDGAPRQRQEYVQHSRWREERKIHAPVAARYLVTVKASADQAGPDKARFAVFFDDRKVEEFVVEGATHDVFSDHEVEVELAPGDHVFKVEFLNDYYKPNDPDPKVKGDRNLFLAETVVIGPLGVLPAELPGLHRAMIEAAPAGASERDQAAAGLKAFLRRAWRRPVESENVDRLLAVYDAVREQGDSHERALQTCVQAALVSPRFLFRVEEDPAADQTVRTIDEHELASRLSYFLWSTMPDDELFRLADEGRLRAELDQQVRRMLADPKAEALVSVFATQWLHLRSLDLFSPDPKRFPDFDDELRQAMRSETERFFSHIVRDDRSVLEMLDSDYTFVNERLAKHYGIDGVQGTEFRKVSIDPARRGGLVAQASFLAVTSNPGRTSPVKRGKWILDNLLASPPPPAPPNVPALAEAKRREENATLRERLQMHRADAICASCHKLMDPLGFGLENFDAIGRWRDRDGAFDIDSSGELPTGEKFAGPKELKAILRAKAPEFRKCLSEKLLTFALGRGIEPEDECLVRGVASDLEAGGDRFSALVLSIVRSEAFQKQGRRSDQE